MRSWCPARLERPDRLDRRVDVIEGAEDARHPGLRPSVGLPCCRGIGIISLISWIATIGKVLAKSRKYIPNQPNDPARMPQSAQVGFIWPQAQGR